MATISSPQRNKLYSAVNFIKDASFQEKKAGAQDHNHIDVFLDTILDFQSFLRGKRNEVEEFTEVLEGITWLNDKIDDELLKVINELVAIANDWRISLRRNYKDFGFVNGKSIASKEVNELMDALDDLKDATSDLELVFFKLPNTDGFQETSTELELIV